MRHLILNQAVVDDATVLDKVLYTLETLPLEGTLLDIGVDGDCDPALLAPLIPRLRLIAVQFPKTVDGRGYTLAYLLRNRLGFTGELRAVGDFTRDQLFYLHRTGFNSMTLRAGEDPHAALGGFNTFSVRYQGSTDISKPLFVER